MFKRFESLLRKFFWFPFILAFIGYYVMDAGSSEMGILEAIYASAALYFVNPVLDKSNVPIIIAQLLALIVTADIVLAVITSAFGSFSKLFVRLHKDSTAVYSDSEFGKQLLSTIKHGYMGTQNLYDNAEATKDHIIMFEDDAYSLSFYESHKASFAKEGQRVFIGLNHTDSTLLRSFNDTNVHFFCIDEIVARDYWKKNNLYEILNVDEETEAKGDVFKIAIIGFGTMGQAIFKQAYLNNLYNLNQKVEYHIWGCDNLDREFVEGLMTANFDTVYARDGEYRDSMDLISRMDRVIVTEGNMIEVLQTLLKRNAKYEIYCCNKEGIDLTAFFAAKNIHSFGNLSELVTCENIKTEALFRAAKLLNYDYTLRSSNKDTESLPDNFEEDLEREWTSLNGFTKGSNVAQADYYWIEEKNHEAGMPDEERWELEHIRWSRYHYYNGWTYAEGPKNPVAKTHKDLVQFTLLSPESKRKDGVYNTLIRKELDELS